MKTAQKISTPEKLSSSRTRIGKLKSASDVAKYIARCIRKTEGGGDENRNYKLTMMASILLKALEVSTLEKRIEQLERMAKERNDQISR